MTLESRNVFIDTSVIVQKNFQFASGRLAQLRRLASNGRVVIYMSDIVEREVRKKISERVGEAAKGYGRFMKDAKILKNLAGTEYALQPALDLHAIEECLMAQFDDFLNDSRTQFLSAGEITAAPILDRYFNVEPPFGPGKKHSEFRDAFNMEALRRWVNDKGETIYVLAGDSDLEKACENEQWIIYLKELAEYLKMVTVADYPDEAAKLDDLFATVFKQLRQKLHEEFYKLEFILEDEDGQVLAVTVNNLQVFLYPLRLSEGEATFDFVADVEYSASMIYDDPDQTIYDKEEDRRIVLGRVLTRLERETKLQGQAFVSVDDGDPAHGTLKTVELEERKVWVEVHETSESP